MIPSASDLARRRHTVIIVSRMLAVVPLGLMTLIVSVNLANALEWDDFDRDTATGLTITLVTGLGAAAFCFFALPALVGYIVPRTRRIQCPFCDYTLEHLTEPRCTECGNPLTPEFMGLPPAHAGRHDEPPQVTVERRRSLFTSIVRLLGISFLMVAVPVATALVVSSVNMISYDSDWLVPLTIALVGIGPPALFAAWVVVFPGMLARRLVPRLPSVQGGEHNSQAQEPGQGHAGD